MEQLVGSNCVACQARISNTLQAENCKACGNPIHTACIRPKESGEGPEVCIGCGYPGGGGYDPSMGAMQQHQVAQGNSAMVIAGSIITIIGFGLLIGNVTGIFRTFPFAGFVVILVGGGIAGLGRRG
ncbi:MAG TPA: hypothetical protein PLN21_17770 [Gemmatales bacterium]|nr:hypothetical protein [Gemmatales bacterium]